MGVETICDDEDDEVGLNSSITGWFSVPSLKVYCGARLGIQGPSIRQPELIESEHTFVSHHPCI